MVIYNDRARGKRIETSHLHAGPNTQKPSLTQVYVNENEKSMIF